MEPQKHFRSRECSMCGDVGFQKELFRCTSCRQRYQHRYCSSFYPNVSADGSQWICDWCISKHPKSPALIKAQPSYQLNNNQDLQAAEVKPTYFSTATTATRSVQSPLDCLLEVAESTLNLENKSHENCSGKPQKHNRDLRNGIPATVKKYREGCSENVKHMPLLQPKDRSTSDMKPMVHKRKRCTDLDISKQEILKHHKFKASTNNNSPTTPAKPSGSMPFSPSKASVGRRYRLLSEVLC